MRHTNKPTGKQWMELYKIMKEVKTPMIPITKGKVETAKKVVIYGPEGIGKSTLAAQFPDPIFIDTEGSTKQLDVKRYPTPDSWKTIIDYIEDTASEVPCKTIVIDTADWAEHYCSQAVCQRLKVKGIEDIGYGKGYVYVAESFQELLEACDKLIAKNINVVFTAHAQMRKFEQPDEIGAYDRWEMKLSKKVAPLLKEWADMVLFCNYKTSVVVDSNTKSKKATGGSRVMYTTHHPCWDAKNRYDLPESIDMSYDGISHIFDGIKTAPSFKEVIEAEGLTMDNIKTFSEAKGNFPGMDPNDYPSEYKEALMRAESISKIKKFLGGI